MVHVVGILNDAMRQGRPSIASVWPTRSDPRRQLGASAFRQLQRNGITQLYTKQRKKKGVIIKRRKRDWESKQKEKRRTRLDSFECLLIYPVVMYVPSKWKLCGRSRKKKERGGGARRAYKLLRSRRDQTAFWCRVSPIPKHAQAVSGVRTCEEVEEEEEGFFRRSRRSLRRDTQELLEWKNVREE